MIIIIIIITLVNVIIIVIIVIIVEKYGAALREMRLAIQRLELHHRILTLLIYCLVLYFSCISVRVRLQIYFERAHCLLIYLIDVYI